MSSTPWATLERVRAEAPLVHNITNYVVMNLTANALLAVGASPVMAHAIEEVEDMVGLARALVINIGTLSPPWVEAMLRAGRAASARGIPIVFDPVGCGATRYRTTASIAILEAIRPTIIRGNASEILALAGGTGTTKGVDSGDTTESAAGVAGALARTRGCVISVSGTIDLVTDGRTEIRIHNGHPIMARTTGMGCTATAVTGAFAAVNPSALHAAAHAMAVMGACGELAASRSAGPGSFVPAFLDALATIDEAAGVSLNVISGPC